MNALVKRREEILLKMQELFKKSQNYRGNNYEHVERLCWDACDDFEEEIEQIERTISRNDPELFKKIKEKSKTS